MRMCKKGQSVLEYVIVLTAIIAVIIAAASLVIRPAVNATIDKAANSIQAAVNQLP